jgi:purine-binding chemotaxis protein CheW
MNHIPALILHSSFSRCALPLACVVETMRPLPVHPLANVPAYVCGASIIRGEPVPVVDLARLLDASETTIGRFVVVRVDDRHVALGVEAVVGVRDLEAARLASLPPLLHAAHPGLVSALGTADGRLLVVLNSAWMLHEEVWEALGREEG